MGLNRQSTPANIRSPFGQFDLLGFLDSQRAGGPTCVVENGIAQLIRERCPISATRAGVPLPSPALVRDLQLTGTPTAGGNLAVQHSPLDLLAGAARPGLVFQLAGIESVEVNDAQSASIPRWRGNGGGWVVEGQTLSAPDLELSTVAVSAHHCGAAVTFSRRLRVTTESSLQAAIVREMRRQVAQALEDGLLNGNGQAGKPIGLLLQAKGAKSFAAATPTWAELTGMLEQLADDDGDLSNSVWIAHPSTAAAMLQTERTVGSGLFLVEAAPGPRWSIAGLPLVTSTAIPEGVVVLLDRRSVAPVYFGPPQLLPDPFSGSNSILGATTIVVSNYCDLAVVEPDLVIVGK